MTSQTVRTPKQMRSQSSASGGQGIPAARGLLVLVAGLGLWQVLGDPDSVFFPGPSSWFGALEVLRKDGKLLPAIASTLVTFLVSLAIAIILGSIAGMLIGGSRHLERGLTPLMDFFRTLPPPAIVPVAAIIFGPTLLASVVIVVIAIVWPILLNTANSVRSMPVVRKDTAVTLGLSPVERITKVLLPSLLPGVFVGTKVAVSTSLVVTLLVDILGYAAGLGRLLVERQQQYDSASVWGILLLIGTFGYVLNLLLGFVETRLLRNWGGAR